IRRRDWPAAPAVRGSPAKDPKKTRMLLREHPRVFAVRLMTDLDSVAGDSNPIARLDACARLHVVRDQELAQADAIGASDVPERIAAAYPHHVRGAARARAARGLRRHRSALHVNRQAIS